MAAPSIHPATSVLGYLQWQPWEYQPYASNAPTHWSSSPLPPGMELDTITGRISGAATAAGVYNVALVAHNGDGDSTPLTITIGIEAAAQPTSLVQLVIDTVTGDVAVLGAPSPPAGEPILRIKQDDDRLFLVRFITDGVYITPPVTSLKFSIKEHDPEKQLVVSTDGFFAAGSGPFGYFLVHTKFERAALKTVLSNYEADRGTFFDALAELEWKETNIGHPDLTVGPGELVRTTNSFLIEIGTDQIP